MDIPKERIFEFWAKVALTANPNRCWEWQGLRDNYGYGKLNINRVTYKAHRLSLALHLGRHPKNHVLHSCDNPSCVNPNHLREGTHKENMQDMAKRKRSCAGRKFKKNNVPVTAKLNEQMATAVKVFVANGISITPLAAVLGVTPKTLGRIVNHRSWAHADNQF